ncbi:MAG TPA: hypothetical protein VFO52_00350 [Longimicrobiales bacterium]|nr:hypothetical protein [Longimicrobiales bacterium]
MIWFQCDPESEINDLRPRVEEVLKRHGVEPEKTKLIFLTDLSARRIKFARLERIVERTGNVRMRVALEWQGEVKIGEATGENGDLLEQRTAATAALIALENVVGESLGIKLVGVKHVRAFDEELMVVALYRPGPPAQRLVGSVSIDNDPRRAAAVAVLNGLNRILGNYLNVR